MSGILHISLHNFLKVSIFRSAGDGALLEEFQTPVAVAVHLLDPAVSATPMTPAESETKEMKVKEVSQSSQDTGANVSQALDWAESFDRINLPIGIFDRCHRRPLLPRQQLLRLGLGGYWVSLGLTRIRCRTFLPERARP